MSQNLNIEILKSFRPINLGMMVFFMLFYRWFYLLEHFSESELLFTNSDFLMVTFAIALGAGSGFMINDLYDLSIDRINHSKSNFHRISKQKIWIIYWILNGICGVLTTYIVFKNNILHYAIIYPLSTWLLWYYSKALKRKLFIGNLTISMLISGLVIFIFPFIELKKMDLIPSFHFYHLLNLTSLAFLLNLSREIIKDIEDRKGDLIENCKTLPIVFGVNKTKQIVVFVLGLTTFIFLFFLLVLTSTQLITFTFYFIFLLIITTLICFIKFAKKKIHFTQASILLKTLMLIGIISVILWI